MEMKTKQKILMLLYSALHVLGIDRLYMKLTKPHSAVILMYHSVSSQLDRDWIDPDNDMPEKVFEEQMQYLHDNCNVVSMDELCSCIRNNQPIKPNTVVISFDDGYRNNYQNAVEILAKYNLPSILYLATGYVDRGDAQWIDELYRYFKLRTRQILKFGESDCFSLETGIGVESAYDIVRTRLLSSSLAERRILLDQIKLDLCPVGDSPRLTLTWQELSEMVSKYPGVTIGVHTRDHIDLTIEKPGSVTNEILSSVADVDANLKIKVNHFSYPYGKWNNEVKVLVERYGLVSAVATDNPVATITPDSDIYKLPRIEVPRNRPLFKHMVSGAYPNLSQLLFKRPHAQAYTGSRQLEQ